MDTLCDDITFHISTYLTYKDMLRLSRVSKNSDRMWGNNTIWKNMLKKDMFPIAPDIKKIYKLLYLKDKINRSFNDCEILLCSREQSEYFCSNCGRRICKKHTHMFAFEDYEDWYIEPDEYNVELCDICFEDRHNIPINELIY